MSFVGLVGTLALAFLACERPPGQEPKKEPSPTDAWKAQFKLGLERKNNEWVFVIEGTTNVPKDVHLTARVYAVEVVSDFVQGKREDEEPLVWDDSDGQPSFHVVEPVGGKFREEVYRFARKPWSLFYRARLHYRPRDQSERIVAKYGDDEWSAATDLHVGTEKEFAQEMQERVAEVRDDLVAHWKLFTELREQYAGQCKKTDAAAWKEWKGPWYAKVEIIEDRNKERFGLWAVWMERQAKMRVGGMCEYLRRIRDAVGERIENAKDNAERIGEMLEAFVAYYEEAIEVTGIPMPLDVERVGPVIAEYEKALEPFRRWVEKGEGPDARAAARRDGLAALFKMPPMLRNRKSAYVLVNDITLKLRKLLDAVESKAPPEELRKRLAEHDDALKFFKKYAGLK